ncbi:Ankyrin repeat protein [Giardia duodenalis]|uniref:Ankyrin repeat protein n=1 Tax=Giardia intestinalis TaxID=5741 RepID=V6TSP0_GIAIN|nr:Ankyrin repeat protein [Giardia intestinalis]
MALLQDERDRRMTMQDLEPYSSMTSVTTSTSAMFNLNLIDGVYTNVTPLMRAVLNDKPEDVDNNLIYVRKVRSDGATALMLAAYLNKAQIAEKLGPLEANIRGPENLTALEIALYKESYAAAAVLRPLEGIDTSNGIKVTTRRHTDLMTAVTEKNPLTVWCLIPLQGRVQDWSGKTALMHAIEQKRTFCARILATAETRIQDRNGFTALMYAVVAGNHNLVSLLAEEEAGFVGRWHEFLPSKFTALILACYYGRLKAAAILLPFEGGIKDSVGRDPRYYAQNCNSRVPAQVRASLMDLFNDYKYK